MAKKIGIISANWGMMAHLPAWEAAGAEVVAVCTSRRETAEAAKAKYGLSRCYWNHAEMAADPEIDIIDVGTRPELRRDMVLTALDNGKHVFASAAFAASLSAAREMRDRARAVKKVGALDSTLPWIPAHRRMRELIDAGAIGRPVSVTCSFRISMFNTPGGAGNDWTWFANRSSGASALRNLGTHALHALLYLLGPVEAVAAQATIAIKEWKLDTGTIRPETEDTAQLMLRFASGVMGVVDVGWASPALTGWNLTVTGEKMTLRSEDQTWFPSSGRTRLLAGAEAGPLEEMEIPDRLDNVRRFAPEAREQRFPQAFDIAAIAGDLIKAIDHGGAPTPSFDDAFHVEQILEAARRAIDERRWVDVPMLGVGTDRD